MPVTRAPLCVKTTSDAPKSLPLVHHLPSIDAGAVFGRFDDAAVVVGFVGLGVLVLEFVFDFVSVVVVLPPAGWANAMEEEAIRMAQNRSSRFIK